MKAMRTINAVDSHTMGEPTRIVVGGVPVIPGKTMPEKKAYLEQNLDHIRTAIMHEPRGHKDMFGSIITQPTKEEADLGIIFMDGGGYLNMCGHGSIGALTVAVELGMVPVQEPFTDVVLEAPAGLVKGKVKVEDGKAKEVSIVNVPSFLYKQDVEVDVPEVGKLTIDISFGGSFFALVKSADLGIDICTSNAQRLCDVGMKILKAVNEQVKVQHPVLEHIKSVDLVEIYGPAKNPKATLQNVVVFGQGQVDRSPCGTGTSAKLATLYAKGQLKMNEEFIYESITGTMFKGKVVGETKVGDYNAIIPEITGSAYITGFNQFIIDPEDPLKYGFTL
ncbi:proline racemase [Caloramator quimbayensis]|uniref:Proline racemase n=1 Tax=Caloramator quimbayensis TaxID=1147123 RepID=A0A1T4XSJ3_9CLOT|nr:proline racemase [Caloramator quimbayensis]SKA92546.1 proline racemase [Caloramator quimbayensis]